MPPIGLVQEGNHPEAPPKRHIRQMQGTPTCTTRSLVLGKYSLRWLAYFQRAVFRELSSPCLQRSMASRHNRRGRCRDAAADVAAGRVVPTRPRGSYCCARKAYHSPNLFSAGTAHIAVVLHVYRRQKSSWAPTYAAGR